MSDIAAGRYKAKASPVDVDGTPYYAQLGVNKNNKEYVRVVFEIVEGELAGEQIAWDGWLTTMEAENRTIGALRLLGWKGTDILAMQIEKLDQVVSITVKREEYPEGSGQFTSKVAWVNDPNANFFRVATKDRPDASAAQRIAKRVASTAAKVAPPAPKATNGAIPSQSDDAPDWL